jgi:hypothetical protein
VSHSTPKYLTLRFAVAGTAQAYAAPQRPWIGRVLFYLFPTGLIGVCSASLSTFKLVRSSGSLPFVCNGQAATESSEMKGFVKMKVLIPARPQDTIAFLFLVPATKFIIYFVTTKQTKQKPFPSLHLGLVRGKPGCTIPHRPTLHLSPFKNQP